jgi:hypothetical protein
VVDWAALKNGQVLTIDFHVINRAFETVGRNIKIASILNRRFYKSAPGCGLGIKVPDT